MSPHESLKRWIEDGWERRDLLQEPACTAAVRQAVDLLDRGVLRVATRAREGWEVAGWLQKAVILFFSIAEMELIESGPFQYHDKIPLKRGLEEAGVRVVPPGTVRYGAYLERGCVVMPAYVNIGAYLGAGTMVDTWATVGSCAQIGRQVHISGGWASEGCSSLRGPGR